MHHRNDRADSIQLIERSVVNLFAQYPFHGAIDKQNRGHRKQKTGG